MLYFTNTDSTLPHFNLAMEEYVLRHFDPGGEYLLLWQNEPAIIIGRHQNALEEIHQAYVKENKIHVVRRLSGGGAVYHDLGNLNFTFIKKAVRSEMLDFKAFTQPVVHALKKLGIRAQQSGRNDLTIAGKKFSGNAQYLHRNNILHHGTLLFDSDLTVLGKALRVQADKIESKGVKSVKSRVTNIRKHLSGDLDVSIDEFKSLLRDSIAEIHGGDFAEYSFTETDFAAIRTIMKERYLSWQWNYGRAPAFNIRNSRRFPQGKIEILLEVKKGLIDNCKIYGDFLGLVSLEAFEEGIKGLRYEEESIDGYLQKHELKQLFGGIKPQDLLACFIEM
jgi:lipoate-protein ligase A